MPIIDSLSVSQSDSALVLVQAQPLEKLFDRATIDPILEQIKASCRSVPTDISTDIGRKAIASLAFKIAKTKTFIEAQRTTLVASEKKRLAAIDAEGKRIREELDSLKDEIRKPLTDWEQAEKQRVQKHEDMIADLGRTDFGFATSADIERRIAYLESVDVLTMAEFAQRGKQSRDAALIALRSRLAQLQKEEADRAELARLRREQEERMRKEREEAIATKARAEAEARAKEAENRAAKAEAEKLAAQLRAKEDALVAEKRAETAKKAAIQQERQRVELQRKTEAEAEARRQADKKHREMINREAIAALIQSGINDDDAVRAVDLIAKGKIPNVKISY